VHFQKRYRVLVRRGQDHKRGLTVEHRHVLSTLKLPGNVGRPMIASQVFVILLSVVTLKCDWSHFEGERISSEMAINTLLSRRHSNKSMVNRDYFSRDLSVSRHSRHTQKLPKPFGRPAHSGSVVVQLRRAVCGP